MIKTLQKKFVFTAMIAVTILLLVMLGGLNIFNAWSVIVKSDRMLDSLARNDERPLWMKPEDVQPQPTIQPFGLFDSELTENDRMGARFFSVIFSEDRKSALVNIDRIADVSETEAVDYALQVIDLKKETGKISHYKYKVMIAPGDQRIKVLFVDMSDETDSILRVLILSVFIGVLCWGGMLIVVNLLSKKAIRPIAENIEGQKQFVTDAGHEIKTPLAIIMANTEAMELYQGESKWSKNIKTQILRLNGLMKTLLNFEKLENEASDQKIESVDFSAMLKEQLQMFEESMQLKGLGVETRIEEAVCLNADKDKMMQLISILTDNAVKYAPDNSMISVDLEKKGKEIIFKMTNECENLPDCPPEKLFDRFYRGDAARTQKSGGYGIGLSAAKTIVEQSGGQINAAYNEPNQISFICVLKNNVK